MCELALVKFDLVCACYVLEFPRNVFVVNTVFNKLFRYFSSVSW